MDPQSIDEDTLAEVSAALTEANEAITRAAEALALALKEPEAKPKPDTKREDPRALANDVSRGY